MSTRNANSRPVAASLLLLVALACPAGVLACGGWFPNRSLSQESLVSAPVIDFQQELATITADAKPTVRALPPGDGHTVYSQTEDAAVADLEKALRERLVEPAKIADRLKRYRDYRARVSAFQSIAARHRYRRNTDDPEPKFNVGAPPGDLPIEFVDYERGAAAYHAGDLDTARKHWSRLLNRPADERRYRSVWAAYMLGRSYQKTDPKQAAIWFTRCRTFVADRFVDSLGLAAASYGWEARAQLDGGQPHRAIELYLVHRDTGDTTATTSLQTAAGIALASDAKQLELCAKSPSARAVVTAYVLSRGGRWGKWGDKQTAGAEKWVQAVEQVGVTDMRGAERLAWMSYHAADYDRARRWADRAGDKSAIALWVRAKLQMRAGEIEPALQLLAKAVRLMPAENHWPRSMWEVRTEQYSGGAVHPASEIHAEIGALSLTAGQYAEALRWLLDATEYWPEVAYIADQVMTPDELLAFVNAMGEPDNAPTIPPDADEAQRRQIIRKQRAIAQAKDLRRLLARRLTRIGRWREGRAFFENEQQQKLDRYIAAIRAGHDRSLTREQRAEHFWEAATIARHYGEDLLGTELDPDHMIHGGSFEFGPHIASRMPPESEDSYVGSGGPLDRASADEVERVQRHRPTPNKRWHYRYTAADHAWSAAQLMDNDTNELAERLQTAGMWLAAKDPQAADRFYKAMVRRAGRTELGQEADRLRWFPAAKKNR